MKKYLLILLSLIIFGGCAPINFYRVAYIHDEFDKINITKMVGNKLNVNIDFMSKYILDTGNDFSFLKGFYLNIEKRHFLESDNVSYNFIVIGKEHWFFVESEDSLVFLIDGEKFSLKNSNKYRQINNNTLVSCTARYPVSIDFLKKIVYANKVKVKIYGFIAKPFHCRIRSDYAIRIFTKDNFHNFRQFFNDHIEYINMDIWEYKEKNNKKIETDDEFDG